MRRFGNVCRSFMFRFFVMMFGRMSVFRFTERIRTPVRRTRRSRAILSAPNPVVVVVIPTVIVRHPDAFIHRIGIFRHRNDCRRSSCDYRGRRNRTQRVWCPLRDRRSNLTGNAPAPAAAIIIPAIIMRNPFALKPAVLIIRNYGYRRRKWFIRREIQVTPLCQ